MSNRWWHGRPVQERLTAFGQALIAPLRQRYRFMLRPGQSFCSPERRLIQIDPESFPDEPPRVQFQATQGVIVHEAGHALFSDAWPEQRADVLCQLSNLLEDERVERAMRVFYPGVAEVLSLRCKLRLAQSLAAAEAAPPAQLALNACLVWRWAKRGRMSQKQMLAALQADTAGIRLWRKVRKLAEEAWDAPDTARVIELAGRILEILGLPPESPRLPFAVPDAASDIPLSRLASALPFPDRPCDGRQTAPADPGPEVDDSPGGDEFLEPAPYLELEDEARPYALRLAEALKVPAPEIRLAPHEYLGRFSARQDFRTPETPCLHLEAPARAARSSAFYLLVDRSGSMHVVDEEVRLALMMLLLACGELSAPVGIAAFGGNGDTPEAGRVIEIAPCSPCPRESAKALIAGYGGTTNCEFLDWGLRVAERALADRPEKRKFLIVVHDGQPVVEGDRELSQAHLKQLADRGVTPVGVYLGDDEEDIEKLHELFQWLILAAPEQLPERLGDLVRSLL